jgi:hypothetical protein
VGLVKKSYFLSASSFRFKKLSRTAYFSPPAFSAYSACIILLISGIFRLR